MYVCLFCVGKIPSHTLTDVFHASNDFLIGNKDFPDGGLVGLLDGTVHPLHEATDQKVVKVHLHVDVVISGIKLVTVILDRQDRKL